tara:strand:+ start:13603 stop:15777 length:2175 start_codon:yes stop_codon:yes gene_type:complete
MIYCVTISVYDQSLAAVGDDTIIIDYAERRSCSLVYEGINENKYSPLLTSALGFSLEVGDDEAETDLFYKNLFSGEEFRFKIEITDQDGALLWAGFLLPDEYSEPYTVGTFYPKFKATDGLGVLKGLDLPDTFYRARNSISKIIADCLSLIPLEFEIWISPGIENGGAGSRLDLLYPHGSSWVEGESKKSAYDVLTDVLNGIGATLYQQSGRWYVIGYSGKGSEYITYQKYTFEGVYLEDISVAPGSLVKSRFEWLASPQVTIAPPFKKVSVEIATEAVTNLLPENIAIQKWTKTTALQDDPDNDPPTDFWVGVGLEPVLSYKGGVAAPPYEGEDIEIASTVTAFRIYSPPTYTQVLNNYIELARPVYVKGGSGEKITFKMVLLGLVASFFGDPDMDNDSFVYDVLLDGVSIFSNRQAFPGRASYFLKFKNEGNDGLVYSITGSLEVENFRLPSSGFLQIRIHHINAGMLAAGISIDSLEVLYSGLETQIFTRTRDLKRSNTEKIDLGFGDSVADLVTNGIIYQPLYNAADVVLIPFQIEFNYVYAGRQFGTVIVLNHSNHTALIANITRLYVRRQDSDYYEYLHDIRDLGIDTGVDHIKISMYDGFDLQVGDRLYYYTPTPGDPQTPALHDLREVWSKKTNPASNNRLAYILAETIHDIYAEPLAIFEGTTKGIIFPGDINYFYFNGQDKIWIPARLEIVFTENDTTVTALEYKDKKVTDYIL